MNNNLLSSKKHIPVWSRLLVLLMLIGCLPLSATSQDLASANLPPGKKNGQKIKSLRDALDNLSTKYGVQFAINDKVIENKFIDLEKVKSNNLEEALSTILKPLKLDFKKVENYYVIQEAEENAPEKEKKKPVSDSVISNFQAITISGRVVDDKGEGLPGVTVLLKGTTTGTTTDMNGTYSLSIPDENARNGILTFSYVGFASSEVAINNRASVDVTLSPDLQTLSEVVVVGYGTQKRSDLTGAVASVKAEEVRNLPVRSVNEALQGRAAGVQVTRSSGQPVAQSDIVIRGIGSIGGMSPLYIVDGIRMSAGNNFNLQDVESIEVLKDASAAAIYGAQAAGGVVLVTTKRGANQEKININFSAYTGIRKPVNLVKLLNTQQYFQAKQAFGVNTSGWGDPNQLPNTDWIDETFDSGKEQSYSLSMAGSSGKSNFYLSANYQREDGIRIDNWFERYGVRANADYQINKKFKIGETLYAWRRGENPLQGSGIPYRSVPTSLVRDPNNPIGGWGIADSYFAGPNPVGNEYKNHQLNETYALEGNVYADWEIMKGLNFRSTFGASLYNDKNYNFQEAYDFGIVKNTVAYLGRDNNTQRNLTANFVLTYGKTIGNHDFKAMAGYEAFKQDLSSLHGEAQNFQVITKTLDLTTDPSTYKASGGEYPQTRLLSQFGRINYSYAGRYLFTANIRRDGSDRFGPANKWGVFPSFSVGWRMNEEAFIQDNLTFVSNLKLRGSYGKLGSTSNIPQFTYQASYGGAGGTNILGLPDGSRAKGYALTAQLPNEAIKWEEVLQTDIGLDIGLFKNQVNVTLDWYNRQTKDMIYQVPTPPSAGFNASNVFTNIGQMSNKGFEIAADYRGKTGGFTYSLGINGAFNTNQVKKLGGTNNNPINDGFAGDYVESTVSRTEAGRPMSQFYGYVAEGLFQTNAEVATLNQQAVEKAAAAGQPTTGVFFQQEATGAGDLRFKDINGDGRITESDKTFIGTPWPKITYGFNINLGYKGFDLTALFQGVQGGDIYNANLYYTQFFVGDYNTTPNIFGTSFFNGNGLTDKPRVGYTDASGNYVRDPNRNYTRISSYYVEKASYLKLRNLQIGYTIPKEISQRVKLANARIYLQGQNLITITKYRGMDPEVLGNNGTTGRGVDNFNLYPRTVLYAVGVDLSF
ncbi:SusC/RagA family TonB-linked outer membrane protein [Adhaeribacter radiodurans]|uniref:TonB-dependent receptor n=1 Tax=Adhaeribacter radiodurans TaxID=2745197 RepID=A0A7L7L8C0_9BACT|nr:TonB-dependent receptor [Adhaeribacter radiodurans]QMU29057.1 TonB-dependent receptor [Adhaeribacter radiodurans]